MVTIERDVAIWTQRRERRCKYPWYELEVGDSFYAEDVPLQSNGTYNPISSVANQRYAPRRFSQRKDGKGLRVWRVA